MDESAKLRMNLVAIQKVDPYAKEIIDSCPHVAFYKYIENEWQKSEIEGSFFIYSRVAEPFHSIFINNRLNTNSLVEPITKPIELQSQPPFLLYRNQRSAISGFWFYCQEDCVRIHALLEKLIKKASVAKGDVILSQQQKNVQGQQQNAVTHLMANGNGSSKRDVDIFSMLSKAQAEFNNSGNGSSGSIEQHLTDMKIGQPAPMIPPSQQQQQHVHHHQPLMKQLSTTMPDITSQNVVNFFAAAQQPNGVIPILADNQQRPPPFMPGVQVPVSVAAVAHPIVQPPVQTLDEIEKQHRVVSVSPKVDPKLMNNLLNSSLQQQTSSPQPKLLPISSQQQTAPPKLLAPTMFQASNIEEKATSPPQQQTLRPEPLTHNQLIQALNYLLENDPEFIVKIHEAYIKSFNKIVSH